MKFYITETHLTMKMQHQQCALASEKCSQSHNFNAILNSLHSKQNTVVFCTNFGELQGFLLPLVGCKQLAKMFVHH